MSARHRRVWHSQAGISLPEVLVAMVVVAIGMFAGLTALSSARKSSETGKGEAQAMALAQRELERVRSLSFSQAVMRDPLPVHANSTGSPAGDENPMDANYYVSGDRFKIMNNYANYNSGTMSDSDTSGEPMVHSAQGAVVNQSDISVDGRPYRIWRFVTRPPSNCFVDLNQVSMTGLRLNTPLPPKEQLVDDLVRRVTVAVLPVYQPEQTGVRTGPTRPLYLSTILVKPGAELPVPVAASDASVCP